MIRSVANEVYHQNLHPVWDASLYLRHLTSKKIMKSVL